ncbi:MAG TPA: transglutaminase-like domain-containing protein [Candidatus Glassbacteria bacterium]|nr:transglutaminase-like domain-containing protein [Candidatus Glassbacteria bacterium]
MSTDSSYYNSKFAKNDILYGGRYFPKKRKCMMYDVRHFIWNTDHILKEYLKKNVKLSNSNDEKVFVIWKSVMQWLKYTPDENSSGFTEFWQFPTETLQLGTGDCEDGAILLTSLFLTAGVPQYRCKVAVGLVQAGKSAKTGGHAWPIYLRESDNEWVIMDWCYRPNNLTVSKRKLYKQEKLYKSIWFTFNSQYSWSDHKLEIKSIKDKI